MILNTPNKFEPLVDINQSQKYQILIELPGVSLDEVELYR